MKLMDADKILEALGAFTDEKHGDPHFLKGIETAREIVEGMPESVVRCGDCKHRWPDLDEGKMICLLDRSRRADDEEWFCADGKRKTAESERRTDDE